MSQYTSCPNLVKNITFWGSYVIFRFYWFTRTLTRIYQNRSEYLSEKSCNFWSKAARAFNFGHFMRNMMHLKVTNYWGSRKIFSMCKIENWAGGAKLHHPPPKIGLIFLRVVFSLGIHITPLQCSMWIRISE